MKLTFFKWSTVEWNIWKHHLDLMEKHLSQVLGESFKISETCKSVTRLGCFTNNSGTVKVLSILEIPIYLFYAKFSLTRCFECNQSAGESGSRSPLLPLPWLPPPLLQKTRMQLIQWKQQVFSGPRTGMQQISSVPAFLSLLQLLSSKQPVD